MHGDDLGVVVLFEIRQQIVFIEIGLVTETDDGRHAHARGARKADDRHADAAGLRRERYLAFDVVGRAESRAEILRRVIKAVNVRPHDAHVVLARDAD